MKTYALYVKDDRYPLPTLVLLAADTDDRARGKAAEVLLDSPHHLSIDVSHQGVTLFTVAGRRAVSAGGDHAGSTDL